MNLHLAHWIISEFTDGLDEHTHRRFVTIVPDCTAMFDALASWANMDLPMRMILSL